MNRLLQRVFTLSLICLALATLNACKRSRADVFKGGVMLASGFVEADKLNLGYETYMRYCIQCHGVEGDGLGTAAPGSPIPPRNFKQGLFKFGSVTTGELPTDDDLKHTIRYGLRGTPMLPWDISDERLEAVLQYIKTFSPVWKTAKAGTPQTKTADPWGPARSAEAIELGKKVYHGFAQCYSCHATYASLSEIDTWSKEMTGNGMTTLRNDPDLSILQDSSYGHILAAPDYQKADYTHKYMPPDYTKSPIKTGGDIESLYQVIGTGIGGTTMPAWKGNLSALPDDAAKEKQSEERLWALAYYVNSLHKLKYDEVARKKFFEELNAKRSKPAK